MENSTSKKPAHVGFIMDGNRRWAKAHGLDVLRGHNQGSVTLENILNLCGEKGIKFVTFYTFSSENWQRSEDEVSGLMRLMVGKLKEKSDTLNQMGAKVNVVGRKKEFSDELQKLIADVETLTKKNEKITVNFALGYGGKAEIVDAVREIIGRKTPPEKVTEELIQENIYEKGQPDLDLIVRTGGVKRLSGFMLWQSTYSELYFTDTLWPDFNAVELEKALKYFAEVKRNFGK